MYAILRLQKIKNRQQLSAAIAHNLRLHNVPNSDPDKKDLNKTWVKTSYSGIVGKMEETFFRLNIKPRKNAVQAVEMILTASPEFFKDRNDNFDEQLIEKWTNDNLQFLAKEIGKDNILNITLHRDETTPHIHILFTPITKDGRLSMKDLYGGKIKLQALQTRYAKAMEHYGLKRGKENSTAEHTSIKEFYALTRKLKELNNDQILELAMMLDQFDQENDIKVQIDNEMLLRRLSKFKPKSP